MSANPVRDHALLADVRAIQAAIAAHPTLAGLHASAAWPDVSARLGRVLGATRASAPGAVGPAADPVRVQVVQWNIEHGNRFGAIVDALRTHPDLAGADVLTLDEVDAGMARAGNRDVAAELAAALGLHHAWAPLFVESTVGRDDDAQTAGAAANEESLFGLAVLSRWPIDSVRMIPLPGPESIQYDTERMLGRFAALAAGIRHPAGSFVAVAAHLEVHRTRAHRAAQMRTLLAALAHERRPVVLAGDWNTHTFDRGLWHTPVSGALPLLTWPSPALARRLRRPDRGAHHELLFDALRTAGFAWEPSADFEPTLRVRFERLEELAAWPWLVRHLARRVFAWAERRAELRLDWIAARGLTPLGGRTVNGLDGPGRASDHAPIVAWFQAPEGGGAI